MKTLFIALILCFGLSRCFAQCDSLPITISIKVDSEYVRTYSKNNFYIKELISRNNYTIKGDSIKEKHFDISVVIKNTSDKAIALWLMKCSWEDNFIINNEYIFFEGRACNGNFPTLVEFKPGQSRSYSSTLSKSIKFDYPCENCIYGPQVETTKLGLIIVDNIYNKSLNPLTYHFAMEDKSKWKIVWSNSLDLLTKNEAHPQPVQIPVYGQK